jgi:hypothetical protein
MIKHERMRGYPNSLHVALLAPLKHGESRFVVGRALQVRFDDLEVIGLALLYPAFEWNACVPGHHGYPRRSSSVPSVG